MYKYLAPIAITLLLTSAGVNASTSSNQAVTVCKEHIKENMQGITRTKLSKVRSSRENHTVTFAVTNETGRQKAKCVVNKKTGDIALQN